MKYDKRCRYIGHSLSGFVKDIINGIMPMKCVVAIHSGTKIETFDSLIGVVEHYLNIPAAWGNFTTDDVYPVIEELIFCKGLYQIRCHGGDVKILHHDRVNGSTYWQRV